MVEKWSHRRNIAWFLLHSNPTEGSTPSTYICAVHIIQLLKFWPHFSHVICHISAALHRIHNAMINVWCKMWPLFHCSAHCMRPNVIFDKIFLAIQPTLHTLFSHSPPWYIPNWIISYSLSPLFHSRGFFRLYFVCYLWHQKRVRLRLLENKIRMAVVEYRFHNMKRNQKCLKTGRYFIQNQNYLKIFESKTVNVLDCIESVKC